jgi:peptidoglycan/LPS O-acetylase OafA/YrhL
MALPRSLPALTAIRNLAAWWVVLYHFKEELPRVFFDTAIFGFIAHGNLAVDLFFELSGFVIALNYAGAFGQPTWVQYAWFLVLRLARIYPLHIFMLLIFVINPISIMLWYSTKMPGERYEINYFVLSLAMVQNWGFTKSLAWFATQIRKDHSYYDRQPHGSLHNDHGSGHRVSRDST